jgi:hypothetical protein
MSTVGGISQIDTATIQGMDLETAMMAVQSNRANVLETQLKDQVSAVQAKNEQIAKLNSLMGALNALSAKFPSDAKAGDQLSATKDWNSNDYQAERGINDQLKALGLTPFPGANGGVGASTSTRYVGGVHSETTKGEIDGLAQQLKSQTDSLSNTQQMDMLRLQSLSNKRNEAFDIMTNFVKKMADSRSSILGNMR